MGPKNGNKKNSVNHNAVGVVDLCV